ncbi:MAG: IS66 family insertion sequence element accessory protein TnpB [Planctomycetes bacterium]|nr:IS66 family insertion sequence element accessory protein TnpB [Planctomycetota bacterium]
MLTLSPRTRVFVAVGATDMRKSFDTLTGLVRGTLAENPLSGHLFVFANRARTRLKILLWDGSGLWVMAKRLARGTFRWPTSTDSAASISMSTAELSMLLSGIDLAENKPRRWYRREATNVVLRESSRKPSAGGYCKSHLHT